jgi:dihydrolipoamide dehydrogenase
MKKYDLIVIGAGSGGLIAAIGANYIGAKVLLIEKEKLGGDCLNYGCIPSKTLLSSAHIAHHIHNAEQYGIHAEIKKIEFSKVIQRIQKTVQHITETSDNQERFEKMGIDVIFGHAQFKNSHEILCDKKTYYGRKIVIASGSRPNIPNIKGIKDIDILTNMNIFSLKKQPEHLIVLGGGPIGCELAQAFQRLGTQVTLVTHGKILSKEDSDVSKTLHNVFEKEGIIMKTHATIEEIKEEKTKKQVIITKNNIKETIEGDAILVSLGRIPNVDMDLKKAGVKYTPKGISVNHYLQTSQKHIYACGDVCGPYQFTHFANYQAGLITKNAFTPLKQKADYRVIPWVTFTDPEIAHVGMTEKQAQEKSSDIHIYKFPLKHIDRAKADEKNNGGITLITNSKGYILGVTIMAPHAGEFLGEYTLAMSKKLKIQDIYNTIHPYPTYSELNKFAAGEHMKTLFTPLLKKFLKVWNGFL